MSILSTASQCLVCGRLEPLGMSVCAACGGARPEVATHLLFVLPPEGRDQRRTVRERLAQLTGRPERSDAVDAASRGLRALARVPAASAAEIVARLEDEGISVTSTRADRAWATVPISFTLLLAAGMGAGIFAGLQGPRVVAALSIVLAGLIGWSAVKRVASPVYPDAGDRAAPAALVRVLAELPAGEARNLTAELSQAAREVLAPDSLAELPSGLVSTLEELLPAAAAAALDLATLDQSIGDFEARSRGSAPLPDTFRRGLQALHQSRTKLSLYLLEVIGLVGRLQGMSADGLTSAGTRLAELTRELRVGFNDSAT